MGSSSQQWNLLRVISITLWPLRIGVQIQDVGRRRRWISKAAASVFVRTSISFEVCSSTLQDPMDQGKKNLFYKYFLKKLLQNFLKTSARALVYTRYIC